MTDYPTQRPFVSVYVIVRKKDKIAFLLRSNTNWMNGYYGLPSGKLEKNEHPLAAASREALEEIGIKIKPENIRFLHMMHRHAVGDDKEPDWISIFFEAKKYEGDPFNAEPDIHSELAWFEASDLPGNVLEYVRIAIEHIEKGSLYSEYSWRV